MNNKSYYLSNALINAALRNVPFTSPAAVYLALFTSAPSEAGGGTEVSGSGYARKSFTMASPSNGATTNSAVVTFAAATADWGTVTHYAVMDALTAGNQMYFGLLPTSKIVQVNDIFEVLAGALAITES